MTRLKTLSLLILKPVELSNWLSEIITALPRIICGFVLTSSFGSDKFGMPWTADSQNLSLFEVSAWFPGDVAAYGGLFAMFPVFFAWMGAFSEAVGGLFVMFGFKTRIFSFLIMCTMLVAIFMQKWGQPLWSMLPALGFLWVSLYSLALGSGRLGLDYIISKKLKS
ncbi:DoxX family protein [Winogradskyella aurantiaca]|uniref:DoxX family protein n=1 Tax=Winogradskyella aurantiaca TaxID=2219558 RepID=UPI000E1D1BCF|nr:DoxX family protein [Winogradskyella aurantiaca]